MLNPKLVSLQKQITEKYPAIKLLSDEKRLEIVFGLAGNEPGDLEGIYQSEIRTPSDWQIKSFFWRRMLYPVITYLGLMGTLKKHLNVETTLVEIYQTLGVHPEGWSEKDYYNEQGYLCRATIARQTALVIFLNRVFDGLELGFHDLFTGYEISWANHLARGRSSSLLNKSNLKFLLTSSGESKLELWKKNFQMYDRKTYQPDLEQLLPYTTDDQRFVSYQLQARGYAQQLRNYDESQEGLENSILADTMVALRVDTHKFEKLDQKAAEDYLRRRIFIPASSGPPISFNPGRERFSTPDSLMD